NPLTAMVEGETAVNDTLVARLHRIIRPFVLRRLKKDVAKQMPGKFEHVVMCPLSKRQAFLYEDFMARSSTRKTMAGGNFIGMMNVLMQLRKVCNHPDLFEPRPITSPWDVPSLTLNYPISTIYTPPKVPSVPLLLAHNATERVKSQAPRAFLDDVSLPEPLTNVPPLVQSFLLEQIALKRAALRAKREFLYNLNVFRCSNHIPMLSYEMLNACVMETFISPAMEVHCKDKDKSGPALQVMVENSETRLKKFMPLLPHVLCYVHKVRATPVSVDISGPLSTGRVREATQWIQTTEAALGYLKPVMNQLHPIIQRSHLFFPDKRLVQFDCGKLQQLDRLLRDLKRDGHRCLIFSQMSSMLNILEIFLNLHGHTYFRLDGSTPVEKRQRLMDRFNSDTKVFCFILSTRSGGLGINLTGADTVIFYDSDWNPAMDAQAQDRAHRIGQTRDVHIYRLVSEHTVEENILKKAQQKRHLDALVMAEGEFTTDYFSKSNLRDLVSFGGETFQDEADETLDMSTIEDAMAQLEDQEDVVAMQQAKAAQRVEKEQDEMDDEEDSQPVAENESDVVDISGHLRPIDRLAMRFRMNIDPLFAVAPTVPLEAIQAQEELELERIEAEKIVEEEAVINDGELIVAQNPVSLKQQQKVYHRERMVVLRSRRLRAISGEAWKIMTCLKSNLPYYYNMDTREAQWDVPRILMKNEDDRLARIGGYKALAQEVVLRILSFCTPLERLRTMALICKSWSILALHAQFHIRIHAEDAMSSEKLLNLQPGDTVVFGSGVHSVHTTLHVRYAVRFLAPLNGGTCTVQFAEGASLIWHANGGEIRGIHFTQLSSITSDFSKRSPLVMIPLEGKVSIVLCNFSGGDSSILIQGGGAIIYDCNIHHASGSGIVVAGGTIVVAASTLRDNGQCGVTVLYGQGIFRKNVFTSNGRYGIRLLTGTQIATVDGNRFNYNCCGAIDLEHSTRRIVVRQSQVTQSNDMIKPHFHNSIKIHDVMLQDVCQEKTPRKKKEKVH
ncbi:SNF2 family helicase/ATPase and F-box protein, partial [Thraustotheca clavata]